MLMRVWISMLLVQATFFSDVSPTPPCYEDEATCLKKLKILLADNNIFWFGVDYKRNCPAEKMATSRCFNPDKYGQNVYARMYKLDDGQSVDLDQLQIAHVTYNSPAGSYYGCGHDFQVPAVKDYRVDPMRTMNISLWSMDFRPEISWSTEGDAPNTTYTVAVWDAGYFYAHALYVNVQGTNIDSGNAIVPYFGPKVPNLRPNVYLVAVFRQKETIDVSMAKTVHEKAFARGTSPLINFLKDLPIKTELLAANVMTVPGDAYSMENQANAYSINSCPLLISQQPVLKQILDEVKLNVTWTKETEKLQNNAKPYIGSLTVDVKAYFNLPDDIMGESCCSKFAYTRSMFMVDPLSYRSVRSFRAKNKPRVKLSPINMMANNYKQKIFTLILVDLNFKADGSKMFVIHWMVSNIKKGKVSLGNEMLSYKSPLPHNRNAPHAYIFFLVEQKHEMLYYGAISSFISDNCPRSLVGRCGVNFAGLMEYEAFGMVRGITWFTAVQDAYVRKLLYQEYGLLSMEKVCSGVRGYEDPCPRDAASVSGSNTIYGTVPLISAIVLVVFNLF